MSLAIQSIPGVLVFTSYVIVTGAIGGYLMLKWPWFGRKIDGGMKSPNITWLLWFGWWIGVIVVIGVLENRGINVTFPDVPYDEPGWVP